MLILREILRAQNSRISGALSLSTIVYGASSATNDGYAFEGILMRYFSSVFHYVIKTERLTT